MKFLKMKKSIALLAVAAVVAIAAIGAYAYFTSSGSGTGSAAVGTSTKWTVTTATYGGGPMTPGGLAPTYETVDYTVTNNSSGQQNLNNVNIKVASTSGTTPNVTSSVFSDTSNSALLFGGGAAPACTASDFELSVDGGTIWVSALTGVNDTRAAGNLAPAGVTTAKTIKIRMIDNGANQDNCKSLSVPLFLDAS